MKNALLKFGILLLLSAVLFVGCTNDPVIPEDTDKNAAQDTNEDSSPVSGGGSESGTVGDVPECGLDEPPTDDEPYVLRESYMPENVSATLKDLFENRKAQFLTVNFANSPFVIRDVNTISDCRLLSITIPVSKTLAANGDGNFCFTLTVGSNGWYQIQDKPAAVYRILINGAEYGIGENTASVNKWLRVDVSEYNIVLSEAQTLGLGSASDTIVPAYLGNGDASNPAQQLIEKEFPQIRGFVSKMGKGVTIGTSQRTLFFDFEWERVYDNRSAYLEEQAAEEEYRQMIEELKKVYKGKKLSILGDSISSFDGISNNTAYNSTIGGNKPYYFKGSGELNAQGLYDHRDAYWHRLITDLEMELCVDNAWSGSKVLDTAKMPGRAAQLHNVKGETPDVIIFYMGINDLHKGSAMGDLYALLESAADGRSDGEKIAEWFSGLDASRMSSFEQAYAICLDTMTKKYPDAEVWCITLNVNRDSRFNEAKMLKFNRCITALAEYFGAGIIDQTKGYINIDNCVAYSCDNKGLHPSPAGHALLEKHIIETLYKKAMPE